jgi:hypothetical protein
MKAYELIEQLKTVSPDCEVYLWVDGDRYAAADVDTSFEANGFLDINANMGENI